MLIFIYLFLIAAIALVGMGLGVFKSQRGGLSEVKLPQNRERTKRMRMRSFLSGLFPFTQRILEKFRLDIKLKQKLDAGHISLTAQEFFNLKIIFTLSFGILAFLIVGKPDLPVIFIGLVLGYVILDFWLNRKISQRKYAIARLLPETVDLLGLCVEAGLDFTTAVKWVIEKVSANPMMDELSFVLEEIKWGKPRAQALKDMSRRLNIPEVSSFVQTLVQAERMGTPVAEAFAILSEDTRLQRFNKGERIAMQAPLKILIPLIFCILPVIGIIIGGPIFLQFMGGDLLKGF